MCQTSCEGVARDEGYESLAVGTIAEPRMGITIRGVCRKTIRNLCAQTHFGPEASAASRVNSDTTESPFCHLGDLLVARLHPE